MNNLNEKTLKELEEEQRRLQDSFQRARETRERYYQKYYLTNRYDFDILECEFQRLKAKETPMLVDCSNFTYKEFAEGKLYFCPKCCNIIKKSYLYCPTCGQHLLWAYINNIRATTEDNENVKKGE